MPWFEIYAYTHHLDWLSLVFIICFGSNSTLIIFFSVVFKDTLVSFLKCNERKATFQCYETPCNFFFIVIFPRTMPHNYMINLKKSIPFMLAGCSVGQFIISLKTS